MEEGNDTSSGKKAASGKVVEDKIVKEKNKKDDKAGDLFPRFNSSWVRTFFILYGCQSVYFAFVTRVFSSHV